MSEQRAKCQLCPVASLMEKNEVNASSILLELVYLHRVKLYASAALLDIDEQCWTRGGRADNHSAVVHHVCAGALCACPGLEEAIVAGLRLLHALGRGTVADTHRIHVRVGAGASCIDLVYEFRGRTLYLAIRERGSDSKISVSPALEAQALDLCKSSGRLTLHAGVAATAQLASSNATT